MFRGAIQTIEFLCLKVFMLSYELLFTELI
jgi:hypothetical protein